MSIHYPTREAARAQMDWFRQLIEEEKGRWWAICLPDDHVMIGAVGFNSLSREHRKAEAGYWLLPDHWGKGYAAEALQSACRFGHLALCLHRIEAVAESDHQATQHVLLRSGFQHEGTLRDAEWKDGRAISLKMYARIYSTDEA
jgi:ribosomal-protein-alanine N-acetyltransferase